jgi:pimeloyl-ACP methyl ester carboxylesterase
MLLGKARPYRKTMHTIRIQGVDLAFIEEGRGPLVLLAHGFPDTAHTWDVVRPAIAAAGFRAVSPFSRGYAPSAIPQDGRYDLATLADDLAGLVRALGDGAPAILVGHDWGAGAAYAAAATHPELVRLLVTVALPHPGAVRPTPRVLYGARHFVTLRLPGAARRIRQGGLAHIDELVQRWSPGWSVPPGETDAVKRALSPPGALEAALGYYAAMRVRPPAAQRRPIATKAVAFAALDDGILTIADYERARRRFSGPYEIVPMAGGHFLHRQHPEAFLAQLLPRIVAAS